MSIPILMYHEVSPRPHAAFRRYTVTARNFARQMQWLATFGYQPIDMDALVRARQTGGALPRRPVVITFDDGFQGFADYAMPVLRAHGFTAVVYLVAGLMGASSRWMVPEVGVELPLMSWSTARALGAEGIQFGAHTMTHPRLAGLATESRRIELVEGRKRLEDELGHAVVHLAYPFGSYDASVQASAADAGYLTACSTRPGLSSADDELLALHRVTIYGHDSLLDFASRLQSGVAVRERIARAVGGVASRLQRRETRL
ncbi:MAG TPA: polysaccharide deacetylase family protein [Gemmatimonadales bacterium]|nr:polysaccharide deacetylase family protein [Gemmatimonadales bacterium]